jgi:hypothetical protein
MKAHMYTSRRYGPGLLKELRSELSWQSLVTPGFFLFGHQLAALNKGTASFLGCINCLAPQTDELRKYSVSYHQGKSSSAMLLVP